MDPRPPTPAEVLEELVNTLRASLTLVTTPPSASMALPASYAGDAAECGGFLLQVALFIEMQSQKFSTERSKVAFLISLLSSKAQLWAWAIWNANSLIINLYDAFTNNFKKVFGSATGLLSVSNQLQRLRQGSSTTSDYTLQFHTLAAASGWNEAALLSAYRQDLDPRSHAQMAIYDDTIGLESFMQRATHFTMIVSLPAQRSCPPACRLYQRFPSTRTYATGFHQTLSRRALTPPAGWTLPLLCRSMPFH